MAFFSLIVLAIPLLVLMLFVRLTMGSPVFFRQKRLGVQAKSFELIKFRTMRYERSSDGELLPDEKRMTKVGRFLRTSSLDELPELWNILRGDMSLVGPRPLLPEYLPYYQAFQARRHEVRPGLTGLAQVSGRNTLTWEGRFDRDIEYVDNLSLWQDLRIVMLTIRSVLAREGISADGHETMPRFDDQVKAGLAKGRIPKDTE